MVAHTCHPSALEAGARGTQVKGQSGFKTVSQINLFFKLKYFPSELSFIYQVIYYLYRRSQWPLFSYTFNISTFHS